MIQQVLDKQLEPVSRRPHERERGILIVSGSVFVFIEQLSGIKDGQMVFHGPHQESKVDF